jgi:hypothetical protein
VASESHEAGAMKFQQLLFEQDIKIRHRMLAKLVCYAKLFGNAGKARLQNEQKLATTKSVGYAKYMGQLIKARLKNEALKLENNRR